MSKTYPKNGKKKGAWPEQAYGNSAAEAAAEWVDPYMAGPGFGLFPPWLNQMKSDFLYTFAASLDLYEVQWFLSPAALENYKYTHCHRQDPPCFDLPCNIYVPPQGIPPQGIPMGNAWEPTLQANTTKGKKLIEAPDQGENQEGEQAKTKKPDHFLEGDVLFSCWEEWHELQLAINYGRHNSKTPDWALAQWHEWVKKWRSLSQAQKDIIGLRAELDKLDQQEKADVINFDVHARRECQRKMEDEIANVDVQKWLPEEPDLKEEDNTPAHKEERIVSQGRDTFWELFKVCNEPPWEVKMEPAGEEWWKDRVVKLSQNVNVHMETGLTHKGNPYTRAIQWEIKERDNEVKKRIFKELQGNSRELIKHVDGHHVLKEALVSGPPDDIMFFSEDIILLGPSGSTLTDVEQAAEWVKLAKQKYGCRVLIAMLERFGNIVKQAYIIQTIIDTLVASAEELAKHKFGFYVIQLLVTFWGEGYEHVEQASRQLITTLTREAQSLMTPEPEKKTSVAPDSQLAPVAGKKSNNNNPDCNGAAVLNQAMQNASIPVDLSKKLYNSVLSRDNHAQLVEMGCTRFGEEAATRALGKYIVADVMTEDSRVDPLLRDAALKYLAGDAAAKKKLSGCRYGKKLNRYVEEVDVFRRTGVAPAIDPEGSGDENEGIENGGL